MIFSVKSSEELIHYSFPYYTLWTFAKKNISMKVTINLTFIPFQKHILITYFLLK